MRIGKILYKINEEKCKKSEISINNIKLDKLTRDYLVELKRRDKPIAFKNEKGNFYIPHLRNKNK